VQNRLVAAALTLVGFGAFGLATVVLWALPLFGFHHARAFGLFAWLLIDREEGFTIIAHPCTLPLTLGLWLFAAWACWRLIRALWSLCPGGQAKG
jgi:hypothetical protein